MNLDSRQLLKLKKKQTNRQQNADSRISGYVWTGPKTAMFVTLEKDWFPAIVTGSRQACTTGTAGKAVTLKPSFQSEAKCEAIDMKITFYSEAKWSSLSQGKVLHLALFWKWGFWNSEMVYLLFLAERNAKLCLSAKTKKRGGGGKYVKHVYTALIWYNMRGFSTFQASQGL